MGRELKGQTFGRLTALEKTEERLRGAVVWRCRCDCGREVLVESRRLRSGAELNCGCEPTADAPRDLTGLRFGRLTVLGASSGRTKSGNRLWQCRCDCGNPVETTREKLLSGSTGSCGCGREQRKDYVGRRFGELTVVSYEGREKGSHRWRCRCDCGGETVVRQSNLQNGVTSSCGCKKDPTRFLHFVDGTCLETIRNRKLSAANTSGIRGVYYNRSKEKWVAQIVFRGKNHYLGSYSTIEEAACARRRGEEMFEEYLEQYAANH